MSFSKENTNNHINFHLTNSDDEGAQNFELLEEWNKVLGIENQNSSTIENFESLFNNIEIQQKHQNYILAEIIDEDGFVCVVKTYITTLNLKKWNKFLEEIRKSNSIYQSSISNTVKEILENVVISTCLIPNFPEELQYSSSCDNRITICRHIKLLHQYLGFQMINDPFYLLTLRGLTRIRFLTILKQMKINLFINKSPSKLDNKPNNSYVSLSQDINRDPHSIPIEEKRPSGSLLEKDKTKQRFANFYHVPTNHHQLNIFGNDSTSNNNLKHIDFDWNPISKKIIDREETSLPHVQKFDSSIKQLMGRQTQEPRYYYHNQMLKAILYNTGSIPNKNQFRLISNLQKIKGIGPKYAHVLLQSGIDNIQSLANHKISQYYCKNQKIPKKHLKKIIDNARDLYLKNKIIKSDRRFSFHIQKENKNTLKNNLTKIILSNFKKIKLLQNSNLGNLHKSLRDAPEICFTKNSIYYLAYNFYSNCIYVTHQNEYEEKPIGLLSNGTPSYQNSTLLSINERISQYLPVIKKKNIYKVVKSSRHLLELQSFYPKNIALVQSKLNTIKSTNKERAFQSSPLIHTSSNNSKNNKFQIMSIPAVKIHRIGGTII